MIMFLILGFICFFLVWKLLAKPSHYPPGFWGLPLIGYLPSWEKSILDQICEARKWAGDILLWRIGVRNIVFLFDFHTIKKLFISNDLADRPEFFSIIKSFDPDGNTGILGSNREAWNESRRFFSRVMGNLGLENVYWQIRNEAMDFVKYVLDSPRRPQPIPRALTVNVFNVAWGLVANKRYNRDDSMMYMHEYLLNRAQGTVNGLVALDLFPWLSYIIPSFLIKRYIREPADDVIQVLLRYFQVIIDEHKENLNEDDPKDYIDYFLIEMKKQKDDEESIMTEKNLLVSVADLYISSSEYGIATLQWILYFIAADLEVQSKLQKEVDNFFGENPKGTDIIKVHFSLYYVKSVIHEVQRMSCLLPTGIGRCNSKDIEVDGVTIPKNSMILPVVKSIHFDERFWEDPHVFRPERFLDKWGRFCEPKEGFMPFGIENRLCPGEFIASTQLIIFLATIVYYLQIHPPEDAEISLVPEIDNFLFQLPKRSQRLVFKDRRQF